MLNQKRVILGMSGGVDSSVAASLLKSEGYEVFGVSMELYSCDRPLGSGCCTPKDRLDARRVCESLKIPFEILDLRKEFHQNVLEYFASEYSRGRTPLPCAPCNAQVRFKALIDYADQKEAQWIATGHYARIANDTDGGVAILRAKERKKDQSYFLWGLSQEIIARLKLPIGPFSKEEVRNLARQFGLATSEKKDSQDLCFVGDDDHARFLEEHFPHAAFPSGDFVDAAGKILGRHHGVHAYTIGQRRGLGVSLGERRYVTRLDAEKNEVVLGEKTSLKARGLVARDMNWTMDYGLWTMGLRNEPSVMVHSPWSIVHPQVQIRSTHPGAPAQLEEQGHEFKVTFQTPQESVTPGQAAVFYDGDRLLGGGWIERAIA